MKRYILLYLLLSLFYSVGAYEIETSSHIYFIITPEGQYVTLGIAPDGVFSVNDKEYTKYLGTILGDEEWLYVDSILQFRKDGTRCFCYDRKTDSEHLLFDFSLKKGDRFIDDFNETNYEVTDVRDTLVNNESLRLIELQDANGNHDIWMEGIGSIYTGILRTSGYNNNAHLLISSNPDDDYGLDGCPTCFYLSNQNIKTADMRIKAILWDKPLETDADWKAYYEWSHTPTNLNAEFVGDSLHVWGRLNTSGGVQPYAACELKGSQIIFRTYPTIFLEADGISRYEIDTRIPGFEKGKYKVKLSWNKTIELECTETTIEPVIFTKDQMATIVLPTEPDAGKGKYYRLDRVEDKQIVFERELQPRARVPYIIVPSEDFSIELSAQEVEGLTGDTVSVEGVSFIGTYHREEINPKEGFSVRIIDTTPDCSHLPVEEQGVSLFVGALRAYLLVHWDDPYNPGGTKAPADKMEIVLKDNPNSIRTLSNSPLKGEDIYDLSGRKLSTLNFQLSTKKKAIYIQNNRKLVK